MENSIREMIVAYRRSAELFAAFESGLIEELLKGEKSIKELASDLELDDEMLALFLRKLMVDGVVIEQDKQYRLTDYCRSELQEFESVQKVIKFEEVLQNSWLHWKEIVSALRKGAKERKFAVSGLEVSEKQLYYQCMYNHSVSLICKQIKRERRAAETVLEFGRSSGLISKMLLKEIAIKNILICMQDEDIYDQQGLEKSGVNIHTVKEDDLDTKKISIVIIHNTIHYLTKKKFSDIIKHLSSIMSDSSLLVIGDIFLDEEEESPYILDWITHGGLNQFYREDVEEVLQSNGWIQKRLVHMKQIPLTLLMFQKSTGD